MNYADFDYQTKEEEKVTQNILCANAMFDMKEVLSNALSEKLCSIAIITKRQATGVAFSYDFFSVGGHAGIAQRLLERIYPDYKHDSHYGDQDVYREERKDNIFIATTGSGIIMILPEGMEMTQKQYEELKRIYGPSQRSRVDKKWNDKKYFNFSWWE